MTDSKDRCILPDIFLLPHIKEQVLLRLDGVSVAMVAVDTLLELIFVDERHNLGEDCFSFVHGLQMAS